MSIIDIFHHRSNETRKVFEIAFEYAQTDGRKLVSLGYVFAHGEQQAMTRLHFELEHHGRQFIKLISPIKAIPLNEWEEYARRHTPSYAANMPSANELASHNEAKVFMVPGIEVKGPLE